MREVVTCLIFVTTLVFAHTQASAEGTHETAIEGTYNAWVKTTNARDLESWSLYLAPNALFVPPKVHP
jgi:ketosteroid isomerase-like protein